MIFISIIQSHSSFFGSQRRNHINITFMTEWDLAADYYTSPAFTNFLNIQHSKPNHNLRRRRGETPPILGQIIIVRLLNRHSSALSISSSQKVLKSTGEWRVLELKSYQKSKHTHDRTIVTKRNLMWEETTDTHPDRSHDDNNQQGA